MSRYSVHLTGIYYWIKDAAHPEVDLTHDKVIMTRHHKTASEICDALNKFHAVQHKYKTPYLTLVFGGKR